MACVVFYCGPVIGMKKFVTLAFAAAFVALISVSQRRHPNCDARGEEHDLSGPSDHGEEGAESRAGVASTAVSYERKDATVTYDDAKTNVDALIKATTNAGYPSMAKTR